VFSNKGFRWKLGSALVVIALLGVYGARRGDTINPPLWRCVVEPARWDNTSLWLPFVQVVSVGAGTFDVSTGDATIRVVGPAPGGVGSFVTLRGIFRADGPRIEMIQSRRLPANFGPRRRLMEIVSIIVVLGVLANFCRHFILRPKVLQVQRGNE
jgi:hypothetical protein